MGQGSQQAGQRVAAMPEDQALHWPGNISSQFLQNLKGDGPREKFRQSLEYNQGGGLAAVLGRLLKKELPVDG